VIPQIFRAFSALFAQVFHQRLCDAFRSGFPQSFRTLSGGKKGEKRAVNEICGNRGKRFPQSRLGWNRCGREKNMHRNCGTWNIGEAIERLSS